MWEGRSFRKCPSVGVTGDGLTNLLSCWQHPSGRAREGEGKKECRCGTSPVLLVSDAVCCSFLFQISLQCLSLTHPGKGTILTRDSGT